MKRFLLADVAEGAVVDENLDNNSDVAMFDVVLLLVVKYGVSLVPVVDSSPPFELTGGELCNEVVYVDVAACNKHLCCTKT
jgi:hypothetical protein